MECVDDSNTTIAYAQWRLPMRLRERLRGENGGGIQAEVSDEMTAVFEREDAASCTPEGEPRGDADGGSRGVSGGE